MLSKLIKHDLKYSAKTFLAMSVMAVALAWILFFVMGIGDEDTPLTIVITIVMVLSYVAIGIASITQIFQFYNQSMFSNAGYLTFTLPVKRSSVFASKIIVSMIWVLFAILTVFVIIILAWFMAEGAEAVDLRSFFGADMLVGMTPAILSALLLVVTMFFCITLSRSVFMGKKIHGVISGVIGFGFAFLSFWLMDVLTSRYTIIEAQEIPMDNGIIVFNASTPMTGLQYGRIVIAENGAFFDVFQLGLLIGLSALVIAATYYLLKKRVSLR